MKQVLMVWYVLLRKLDLYARAWGITFYWSHQGYVLQVVNRMTRDASCPRFRPLSLALAI
jgi:hypothetical protein